MKKLESLKGITKEGLKEMDFSNLQQLVQVVVQEKQAEQWRTQLINILDMEKADSEIIDSRFEN